MEYHVEVIRVHVWVMATKISMGYWVWESMGYGHEIPANQFGKLKILWVIKEYGLYGVWVISELTVLWRGFKHTKALVRKLSSGGVNRYPEIRLSRAV